MVKKQICGICKEVIKNPKSKFQQYCSQCYEQHNKLKEVNSQNKLKSKLNLTNST